MNPTIGERIREIRQLRKLTQDDLEERTGLVRSYISRIETGITEPALESIEKLARSLDVPLWYLFYGTDEEFDEEPTTDLWGTQGRDRIRLKKLKRLLRKVSPDDQILLLEFAGQLAKDRKQRRKRNKAEDLTSDSDEPSPQG